MPRALRDCVRSPERCRPAGWFPGSSGSRLKSPRGAMAARSCQRGTSDRRWSASVHGCPAPREHLLHGSGRWHAGAGRRRRAGVTPEVCRGPWRANLPRRVRAGEPPARGSACGKAHRLQFQPSARPVEVRQSVPRGPGAGLSLVDCRGAETPSGTVWEPAHVVFGPTESATPAPPTERVPGSAPAARAADSATRGE
jgi:hypothetical protein